MSASDENAEEVVMYVSPFCGYCMAAKRLLRTKGVPFTEINVLFGSERRREMVKRSARHTVPQIFIRGRHVGGFDELNALEKQGQLDGLLEAAHDRDDSNH